MLTIVFYFSNGAAAKLRSREIAALKGNYARVYDAGVWDGAADKCDFVEIMSDVPNWQRKRITEVYGDEVKEVELQEVNSEVLERKPMGLMPELQNPAALKKEAKHRGGGRWFVMEGENIISGPHDKAEAVRLAT